MRAAGPETPEERRHRAEVQVWEDISPLICDAHIEEEPIIEYLGTERDQIIEGVIFERSKR